MFWNCFYELCQKNEIKPLNVAKALKIGAGSITKWKNGTIPNGETLGKIADYFNVSIDYLLGRTDVPEVNYGNTQNVTDLFDELLNETEEREKLDELISNLTAKRESLDETVDALKQLKAERVPQ